MNRPLSMRLSTTNLISLSQNDFELLQPLVTDINQNNGEIFRNVCWLGAYDLLKYLIDTYSDIDIHRKNENAFKGACLGDHHNIEMAKLLLEKFPHINLHIDNDYIFKTACERNLISVIKLYLDRCPNINVYEDINTGYLLTFKYHHDTLIHLLSDKYPELLETNYSEVIYLCCKHNHLDLLQWVLNQKSWDKIDYERIFALELKPDLFLWLYERGYYNYLNEESKKRVLYDLIQKQEVDLSRMILKDHPKFCDHIVELGTSIWSYDISYTIYKILDVNYLNEKVCTQALKYCLKNNLVEDCRILMDRPNTLSKLDFKLFCYENNDIKADYYAMVEMLASKNEAFKKMYRETIAHKIKTCFLTDDVDSFIFLMNSDPEIDRYDCFLEAGRYNSLQIIQCLSRTTIVGKFRIPQDISELIVTLALKEGHPRILQYLYTTYNDYAKLPPKEVSLGYIQKLSSNMIGNLMWLICRYPKYRKQWEHLLWTQGPQFKVVYQRSDEICMICKITHKSIIKLPCSHYICFEQMCHFRVEADIKDICLACRKNYSWKHCIMYLGKKTKLFL